VRHVVLENIDADYYDGPLSEVNVVRDPDGEIRIQIKVSGRLEDTQGWCEFTPSLEEVEAWCAKARKHMTITTPKEGNGKEEDDNDGKG
jgi:hypothetical protein